MSIRVGGEWVNVGTVGHLDYPKVRADMLWPAFVDAPSRCEPVAEQCEPDEKQKPTKHHKLLDRWGRLK